MRFLWLLLLASCITQPHQQPVRECSYSFWQRFHDPILVELVEKGQECSFDVEIAKAKLCQARLERKKMLSAIWPRLGLNFDTGRFHLSDEFPLLSTDQGFNIFEGAFDASWEIDLFGAKYGQRAAKSIVAIEEEQLNMVRLTTAVEIARSYFDLRYVQNQEVLIQKVLKIQNELLHYAFLEQEHQLAGSQKVFALQERISKTEDQLLVLANQIGLLQNRIAFLINEEPGSLSSKLSGFSKLPQAPQVRSCSSQQLLQNRPDLRIAEQLVCLKSAEVGLSLADFFPNFDLLANVGYLSRTLSKLFSSGSYNGIYNFFTRLPLFEGGRLTAQLNSSKSKQHEALLQYSKAALGALHEVDSALTQLQEKESQLQRELKNRQRSEKQLQNMETLYKQQLVSKEKVKSEQLHQIASEAAHLKSQAALLERSLALYKACGGH
ncbi:MAG: Outer membrane protein OprM [Chlamydiales bacterium]|nr:Outer membrane protein OprM [Chlamydiales bacterium]MCH9635956.1 Outer membrane protein OprM [Chlamydiales bacterium]MCH9703242.1 efflux transporter outer membrane subunit [Chlamydiota bacterium]